MAKRTCHLSSMSTFPTPQTYALCSSPRSGTTLLCNMLRQTGVAGAPDSFFREKSFDDWCAAWDVPRPLDVNDPVACRTYVQKLIEAGRGKGGLFGMRIMGPDINMLRHILTKLYSAISDHDLIEAAFGPTRYIHLSRLDKVAEAVSYLRAEQTGLWHGDPAGNDIERIAPSETDGYDAARIAARVQMLGGYDAAWRTWFQREGITPLFLTYEGLSDDPLGTLRKVLTFLDQDPHVVQHVTPGTRKLADDTSQAWITRFKAAQS